MTAKINNTNSTYNLIKRLVKGYLTPHKGKLSIAICCMITVAICTALTAKMMQPILDELLIAGNKDLFFIVPALVVTIFFVKGIAGYFQNFIMEFIGQRIVADLQGDLYEHVIHHDLAFLQKETTSGLASRFIYDLHQLKKAISSTITGVLRDIPMIIGLIALMIHQNWKLALICLTIIPLASAPIVYFGKRMRKYSGGTQEEMGAFGGILKESFSHIRQVKSYTMENYEITRSKKSIDTVFNFMIKMARVRALSSPVMELLGGLIIASVIMYGCTLIWSGDMTAGEFMSFLTAAMTIYRPLKSVTNINNNLQEGLASAQRTFELIDQKPTITNNDNAPKLNVTKGEVVFENVSFNYEDGTKAISNLNLTIPAGKTVALVGASGAGKSTVLNLIPRFFDPSKGSVKIDGVDIRDVTLKSLRENIGLVTQEVAIFNDSIKNNIAYGINRAKKDDIIKAAKDASAHSFIEESEKGYATIVGEDGFSLSGGQRQRIAIARAMLKNAPILLLDEATSSLDTASEKHVQKALNKLMKGRTSLVVAHRLSTIVDADIIHVLRGGKVIETGTHETLLASGGAYARLHKMQNKE
tara:strand:+ start:116337 stop:118094 length:1758 start_codon:yes stop_codon:yes gene_type:complete